MSDSFFEAVVIPMVGVSGLAVAIMAIVGVIENGGNVKINRGNVAALEKRIEVLEAMHNPHPWHHQRNGVEADEADVQEIHNDTQGLH